MAVPCNLLLGIILDFASCLTSRGCNLLKFSAPVGDTPVLFFFSLRLAPELTTVASLLFFFPAFSPRVRPRYIVVYFSCGFFGLWHVAPVLQPFPPPVSGPSPVWLCQSLVHSLM